MALPTNGKITIFRTSRIDADLVRIEVLDQSGASVQVTLSLAAYAEALLGLARVPCETEVSKLDKRGKTRTIEQRQVIAPNMQSTKDYAIWLEQNAQEEGYELDTHLGSQNSVSRLNDDEVLLRYKVVKYS